MGALVAVIGIFGAVVYSFHHFLAIRHHAPETLAERGKRTANPVVRYITWFFVARRSPEDTANFRWFSLAGMLFFLVSWLLMHVNYLFLQSSQYAGASRFLEMIANLAGIFVCCLLASIFLMGLVLVSLPASAPGQIPEAAGNVGDDKEKDI